MNKLGFCANELPGENLRHSTLDAFSATQGGGFRIPISHDPSLCTKGMVNDFKMRCSSFVQYAREVVRRLSAGQGSCGVYDWRVKKTVFYSPSSSMSKIKIDRGAYKDDFSQTSGRTLLRKDQLVTP